MGEEKKYEGVSPKGDFEKALRKMLQSFDALEDENIPFDQYPHNDYAKFFMLRIRGLHENANSDLNDGGLTPVEYMHIPFRIAKGDGEENLVTEYTRKNYCFYVEQLIKRFDQDIKEQIDEKFAIKYRGVEKTKSDLKRHLKMYRDLEGSRIFDLESYEGWNKKGIYEDEWDVDGWNPKSWNIKSEELSVPIGDLEEIGKEFKFSYAMASLAQLWENQCKLEPFKKQWIPYFCGLVAAEEIYNPNKDDKDLEKLREFLTKDYQAIIDNSSNIEYLESCLKYFNPFCMTKDEMNRYFICSIAICAKSKESPYATFFKRVFLFGRLNKVHCIPINYIESNDLVKQRQCRLKINVLRQIVLNEGFRFPSTDKLKKVDEDWSKSIKIFSFKEPYNVVFSMLCDLLEVLKKFENIGKTGNQKNLEENKNALDKAISVYPILDWIEPDLDHPSDRNHSIFAACIKAICKYSTNPEEYNKKIMEYGIALIPYIETQLTQIEDFSSLVENTNNSIVPEIFSLIGFAERMFYPCKLRPNIDKEVIDRVVELRDYLTDESNHKVLAFRSLALMGKIFAHPKITKFITIPDFESNIAWGTAFKPIALNVGDIFGSKAQENIMEKLKSCDPSERVFLEKKLEYQDIMNQATQAIETSLKKTVAQSGKIDLENCNPEKPIS